MIKFLVSLIVFFKKCVRLTGIMEAELDVAGETGHGSGYSYFVDVPLLNAEFKA